MLHDRPDRARCPPPRYGPLVYSSIAREIRTTYSHDADDAPEVILEREQFSFAWADVPSCGCVTCLRILAKPVLDRELRALIVHHERAHAWLLRRGLIDATESDAWFVTRAIVIPFAHQLPMWFRVVAELLPAA